MYKRMGLDEAGLVATTPEQFADAAVRLAASGEQGQRMLRKRIRSGAKQRIFGQDDAVHEWVNFLKLAGRPVH
jgi:hypothetical protein